MAQVAAELPECVLLAALLAAAVGADAERTGVPMLTVVLLVGMRGSVELTG